MSSLSNIFSLRLLSLFLLLLHSVTALAIAAPDIADSQQKTTKDFQQIEILFEPGTRTSFEWSQYLGAGRSAPTGCLYENPIAEWYGLCDVITSQKNGAFNFEFNMTPYEQHAMIGKSLPAAQVRLDYGLEHFVVAFVPIVPFRFDENRESNPTSHDKEHRIEIKFDEQQRGFVCDVAETDKSIRLVQRLWHLVQKSNESGADLEYNYFPANRTDSAIAIECVGVLFDGLLFKQSKTRINISQSLKEKIAKLETQNQETTVQKLRKTAPSTRIGADLNDLGVLDNISHQLAIRRLPRDDFKCVLTGDASGAQSSDEVPLPAYWFLDGAEVLPRELRTTLHHKVTSHKREILTCIPSTFQLRSFAATGFATIVLHPGDPVLSNLPNTFLMTQDRPDAILNFTFDTSDSGLRLRCDLEFSSTMQRSRKNFCRTKKTTLISPGRYRHEIESLLPTKILQYFQMQKGKPKPFISSTSDSINLVVTIEDNRIVMERRVPLRVVPIDRIPEILGAWIFEKTPGEFVCEFVTDDRTGRHLTANLTWFHDSRLESCFSSFHLENCLAFLTPKTASLASPVATERSCLIGRATLTTESHRPECSISVSDGVLIAAETATHFRRSVAETALTRTIESCRRVSERSTAIADSTIFSQTQELPTIPQERYYYFRNLHLRAEQESILIPISEQSRLNSIEACIGSNPIVCQTVQLCENGTALCFQGDQPSGIVHFSIKTTANGNIFATINLTHEKRD